MAWRIIHTFIHPYIHIALLNVQNSLETSPSEPSRSNVLDMLPAIAFQRGILCRYARITWVPMFNENVYRCTCIAYLQHINILVSCIDTHTHTHTHTPSQQIHMIYTQAA
jgi:hypothetical protein